MGTGKEIVIDTKDHLLGRLASVVAKQLLSGYHIVCVRCEAIQISGGLIRQKMKFERFLRKRMNTKPSRGPIHYRSPARMLWRTIRGMLPHKTTRGETALRRLKCFEGIPPPYDCRKRVVVPRALKVARLRFSARACSLGDLADRVGWKNKEAVADLEEIRKVAARKYYENKKKIRQLRRKAAATLDQKSSSDAKPSA